MFYPIAKGKMSQVFSYSPLAQRQILTDSLFFRSTLDSEKEGETESGRVKPLKVSPEPHSTL